MQGTDGGEPGLQPEHSDKLQRGWTAERRAQAAEKAKAWWTPERRAEARRRAQEWVQSAPLGTFKTDAVTGGATFGYLTVLAPYNSAYHGAPSRRAWICRCKCGGLCVKRADKLLWGAKKPSCGCRYLKRLETSLARLQGRLEKELERQREQRTEREDLEARLL